MSQSEFKFIKDIKTTTSIRPTINDPRIQRAIKQKIMQIIEGYVDESDLEDIAEEVVLMSGQSGYELARFLDDTYFVEVDDNLVEELSFVSYFGSEKLSELEKLWVKEHDIKCPFVLNQSVKLTHLGKTYAGVVVNIWENNAHVTVCVKELGHEIKNECGYRTGLYKKYEEVESL